MTLARPRASRLAAGLALGAFLTAVSARAVSPALPVVRTDVVPYLSYSPLFVAADRGYFRDAGIQVELVPLWAHESLAAAIGGKIDVFTGQLVAGLFNAMAGGSRLAIVADKGHIGSPGTGCAYEGFVLRNALYQGPVAPIGATLRGRRVAVKPFGILDFLFDRTLQKGGLTRADVKLTDLDSKTTREALRQGALDLKLDSEPTLTRERLLGASKPWLTGAEIAPGQQTAVVAFGPRLLDREREAGKRFLTAYLRAVRDINKGKTPELVSLIARRTELPEDVVREACWGNFRDDGQIDVPSVMAFQEWAKARGLQDAIVPVERFWDPSFLGSERKP